MESRWRGAPLTYLLGIGHATLDHQVQVDRFPDPDSKVETPPLHVEGGGPAATAMVAASRMGQACRLAGAVGADARGDAIRQGLLDARVDVGLLLRRPARRSPFSFVVVEREGGRRTIYWNRGDAEPLRPEELPRGLVEGARAVLVDGHQPEAQAAAARRARAAGIPVLLDAGSLRPATRDLLPLADHAVVSEAFARDWCGLEGTEALGALRQAGPAFVVITRGAHGCLGGDGERTWELAAHAGEAVDTTGAGDVFHGAYLVGMASGMGLEACMRLANAAAGLKCRARGPRRGIPGLAEALAAAGLR